MRILFDGFWWADGPMANRTVQREFISAWNELYGADDELIVALRKGVPDTDLEGMQAVRTRLWPHALSNRLELSRLARAHRVDHVVAHNYAPRRGSSLVFIHDVMYEEHPEWFSTPERLYFSPMLPWARSATVVAASTDTEAKRISRLGRDIDASVITGLAAPSTLVAATARRPLGATADDFALTVGRLNVRKNLESVLRGVARSRRVSPATPLYVVGSTVHSGKSTEIPADVRSLVSSGAVVFLGQVDDAELAWLYENAGVTISLSLDEGFGMPAVEAAMFRSPLLVSDIDVYRETVGDVARFVDPLAEPGILGDAIDQAWGRPPTASATDAVRRRFTWPQAVTRMRDRLRELSDAAV